MATTQTANEKALDLKPGARGRKDNGGQEVEPNPGKVTERKDDLISAKNRASNAAEAYSKLVKLIAKEAGMNAQAVRKFVDTCVDGDESVERTKRYTQQLALLLETVDE